MSDQVEIDVEQFSELMEAVQSIRQTGLSLNEIHDLLVWALLLLGIQVMILVAIGGAAIAIAVQMFS